MAGISELAYDGLMIHKVPDVFIKRPKLICDLQHQQDVSLQQFKGHG
jgi:hypothetical protein